MEYYSRNAQEAGAGAAAEAKPAKGKTPTFNQHHKWVLAIGAGDDSPETLKALEEAKQVVAAREAFDKLSEEDKAKRRESYKEFLEKVAVATAAKKTALEAGGKKPTKPSGTGKAMDEE
jgi:cellobiose phosphorylase